MSGGAVIPRVSMSLFAALVLDYGSDVPYAHLERQLVLRVHAAQLAHELDHVLHGAVRQALHAHECPAASLREAGDRPCLDSVKVSHAQPPCSAARNRPRGEERHPGTLAATRLSRAGCPASRGTIPVLPVSRRTGRGLKSDEPARLADLWRS